MKEAFRLTETARHVLRQYGLEPDKLTNCSVRTYHFGEHIITEGIPNEYLFLVTAGRAKVGVSAPNGKNIILCFYISKGLMGEAELYARMATGSTTITVLETLTCIAIPVPVNRAYLDSNLAFTRMAAAALADKLLQRAGNVVENTLYTAQTRLCRYILGAAVGGRIRDVMTDMACSIGISYRHLYRMMGRLCREGILEKGTSGYRICEWEKLQELSQQR